MAAPQGKVKKLATLSATATSTTATTTTTTSTSSATPPATTTVSESLSYWDWLPPELQLHIRDLAVYATAQERLDKGWKEVHQELDELPKCRLYGTVMNLICLEGWP